MDISHLLNFNPASHFLARQERTLDPESMTLYGQLIFDIAGNISSEKDSLSNKLYWENWPAICKRMKLDQVVHLHHMQK